LKKQLIGTGKIEKAIKSMEESALVQARLINDLLDISSIILGKVSIELKNIKLVPIILSSIESLHSEIEKKSIHIELKTNKPKLKLNLDAHRIRQVFCNLLTNAIKFSQINGKIEINILQVNKEVQIKIKDNGQGISAELLPHIFERFTQGYTTHSPFQEGLGLGLALVKSFLELQGASIYASSDGLNMGSTFTIVFKNEQ
jgi:signal transduction histidine kinase